MRTLTGAGAWPMRSRFVFAVVPYTPNLAGTPAPHNGKTAVSREPSQTRQHQAPAEFVTTPWRRHMQTFGGGQKPEGL
jgi:hypothetical protein